MGGFVVSPKNSKHIGRCSKSPPESTHYLIMKFCSVIFLARRKQSSLFAIMSSPALPFIHVAFNFTKEVSMSLESLISCSKYYASESTLALEPQISCVPSVKFKSPHIMRFEFLKKVLCLSESQKKKKLTPHTDHNIL